MNESLRPDQQYSLATAALNTTAKLNDLVTAINLKAGILLSGEKYRVRRSALVNIVALCRELGAHNCALQELADKYRRNQNT